MYKTDSKLQKLKQFLSILLPILITQVLMFSMNFFNTVMSGQASAVDLAGVAIGSSIWVPIGTGLGGIFIAITPIVAQLIGSNCKEKVPHKVIQGVYLAFFIAVMVIFIGAFSLDWILSLMDLDVSVHKVARGYLIALAFGIPALFIYQVLRSFIDALGKTRISMMITLFSLPINVLLNYILIYGKIGLPAFGGIGAGIASAVTYWCLVFIAILIIKHHPSFSTYYVFDSFHSISRKAWKEQLKIGIPVGFSIFFETSIFSVVTILMSDFNTITIAGHQGAMNFASMLYMSPLSISMALTILVGFEAGAHRFKDARQYSILGIGVSLTMALLMVVTLLLFREKVAGLYSKDFEVIQLTKQFLIYALFFQFSDAVATPIQGVLRGYKDVNITFILALISYWIFALPIGYFLSHYSTMGAFGYWIGLISGITLNAISLLIRLFLVQHKQTGKIKTKST
jgi:multidrug resistance protein, MATE family